MSQSKAVNCEGGGGSICTQKDSVSTPGSTVVLDIAQTLSENALEISVFAHTDCSQGHDCAK